MLFNSAIFIIFATVFFGLWQGIKSNTNARLSFITFASFIFYGWWDWRFLFLIVGSGLLDYSMAWMIAEKPRWKKIAISLSIIGNVGSLAAFKYSGFLFQNIDLLLSHLGVNTCLACNIPDFMLITPVGISFYTFQSMSYTLDVYHGKLKPTKSILLFFAYLSMFPQLVAGPIVRARDLLPQMLRAPKTTEQDRWEGFRLIVHGFFKKMVLADNLAPIVNQAFVHENMHGGSLYWWLVMSAFAFQIYFDFSAYSDIARGLARWMGLRFELNFNHPYTSLSLKEFWTRWHISLSSWFRDYVYIPLGGSKNGKWKASRNMWISMLVSGLWHGANWTFVIWGGLHALFLQLERWLKWPDYLRKNAASRIVLMILVTTQVWIAWVFFRADSASQAWYIIQEMFSFQGGWQTSFKLPQLSLIAIGFGREFWVYHKWKRTQFYPLSWDKWVEPILLGLLMVVSVFLRGPGADFIYFQF